jgi:quercetin dioxygenase-like cupin family protein
MTVKKQAKEEAFTGKENAYEAAMKEGRDHLERQRTGVIVVKSEDRPWQQARQGKLKYHLIPSLYKDTVLQTWRIFSHEITTQSGKHRHQGGVSIYVLEGKGYTIADGQRVDWEAGDLIVLPIKPNGVEHQHFNLSGKPSKWIAFVYLPLADHMALHLEQKENAPQHK